MSLEERFLKFRLTVPAKPIPTTLMIKAFNEVWEYAKPYRNLQNATDKPFTDDTWQKIIDGYDEIIEKYPYPFVENLLTTFLKEFEARDRGGYSFSVDNDTEHDFTSAPPEPTKPPEIDGFV
jgi:hypothetical protein